MQSNSAIYKITVKSQLNTIQNQFTIKLTDEAVAGIMLTANLLLGNYLPDYFIVEQYTEQKPFAYYLNGQLLTEMLEYTTVEPYLFHSHILADLDFVMDPIVLNKDVENWSDYIAALQHAAGHIFNMEVMSYHLRLTNRQTNRMLIVQFKSRQFVQGVYQCLSWFKLPPNDYLDLIGSSNQYLNYDEI